MMITNLMYEMDAKIPANLIFLMHNENLLLAKSLFSIFPFLFFLNNDSHKFSSNFS